MKNLPLDLHRLIRELAVEDLLREELGLPAPAPVAAAYRALPWEHRRAIRDRIRRELGVF